MDNDKSKMFMSLELCYACGSRMSAIQDCEHLAAFHPQLVTIVKEISEKVKNFPDIKQIYPSMDCRNLCAAKVIANRLIENFTRYNRSSLDLIQQLSEIITNDSDINLYSNNQKSCNLCGLLFKSTQCTITHLMKCHPECLALIQFLRCRPMAELNFQKDIVLLNKKTTQELIMQITNSSILANCQPFLRLEKLPSRVYHECITKGYVTIKENNSTQSLFNAQPSPRLNAISVEVMQKIRETVANSPFPNKSNITVVLVPKKFLEISQENSNSEKQLASCKKGVKNSTLPTTSKIIRYGVEDLKRDQLRRQQEKEKITKKEEILKKMLSKYHEKETKKQVLYWQKTLTRYVMQHQKLLFKLENSLINARKWVTSKLRCEQLLEKLNFYVTNVKVVKAVTYLLKKLFDAIKNVPAKDKLSSKKDSSIEEFDESILQVNHISKTKVLVQKNRQNLSSNLHLTSEVNINDLPLQGIPKVLVSEDGNDNVLVQKRIKEKWSSEKDGSENEFEEPILHVAKKNSISKTKKQVAVQTSRNNLSSNKHLASKEDICELPLQDIPKYVSSEVGNNKALGQRSTKEELILRKNSSEGVDDETLHDVLNPSNARKKVLVGKRLKISKKPWDEDEFNKPIIPRFSAFVRKNNKFLVQKRQNKFISEKNSSEEAILQDVENYSTSNAGNKAPMQKRLKMSKKPWTSDEVGFEDKFNKPIIPRYSAPVVESYKVPVQERKNKLISGKNSLEEVDEAILQDVPEPSTSNARNKAPVRKRRLKMSTLPWTSEEDSSEDEFDKPIIPRYFAPALENYKLPVQKRKKKRVVLSSEVDSSEEEVDAMLFQLLQNFYTFKPKNKVPVQKSGKKISSTVHLTSEKSNCNKEIDKPKKYSPAKVTKLVPVPRRRIVELSNLNLTSKEVDKLPLRGFQKCPSTNVGNDKKLILSSFPIKKYPAAFSKISVFSKEVDKLPLQGFQKFSSPKVGNDKKLSMSSFPVKKSPAPFSSTSVCELGSGTADPFVNTTLITDNKQFLECYCGKLNCDSLHPENFY